ELREARSPAGAVLPPRPGPVDDRLLGRLGLYLTAELGDPRSHGGLAEPVTLGAVRVVLNIKHDRRHPAARFGEGRDEVVRWWGGAAGAAVAIRDREHVGDHRQPGGFCLGQVLEREGILVVGALGGLDRRELNARLRGSSPINSLPTRVLIRSHVHALQSPRVRRAQQRPVLRALVPAGQLAEYLGRVSGADVEVVHPLPVALQLAVVFVITASGGVFVITPSGGDRVRFGHRSY